jgi:hypothetical protein
MLAGFDVDITNAIPDGAEIEVDPQARTVRVISIGRRNDP